MTLPALGRRGFLGTLLASAHGAALGRTPVGGVLRLSVPFRTGFLDPHALDDPLSALFAASIADSLYALDSAGKPYPALAAALPERTPQGTRVLLRPELSTARGKALGGLDVAFALKRALERGGIAPLGAFSEPTVVTTDPLAVLFPNADPESLAFALASPLTAIVPRGFSPARPDGTGAFAARLSARGLVLERNTRAARGAAFLDRIEITPAQDLAQCLRAFEAGSADVGWLGSGLYHPRPNAVAFEGPRLGWVILRTGLDAGTWGAPGIAQALRDALPDERLSPLGLRSIAGTRSPSAWGGPSTELLVIDDAAQLLEIARVLASELGRPGHDVRVAPIPRQRISALRRSRHFGLMLDFVQNPGLDLAADGRALLAAVDPDLAKHPTKNPLRELRDLTRTLTLGVVGEFRASGARMPDIQALDAWQLGAVFRHAP